MRECRVCGSKIPDEDCTPIVACCRQCDCLTLDMAAINRLPKEGDESGKTVGARTDVFVSSEGWVRTSIPGTDISSRPANQGEGSGGWTCVGFQFAEAPDTVYPQAQGWIDPGAVEVLQVEMIRHGSYNKRVIARIAIWERASG